MAEMKLQDYRAFVGEKRSRVSPITLLVGENSTGKSSFLASIPILWDCIWGNGDYDFNREPFLLGSYDQIANYRGGRAGRAASFEFSFSDDIDLDGRIIKFEAQVRFSKGEGQPVAQASRIRLGDYNFLVRTDAADSMRFSVLTGLGRLNRHTAIVDTEKFSLVKVEGLARVIFFLLAFANSKGRDLPSGINFDPPIPEEKLREARSHMEALIGRRPNRPYAWAPVRTRPRRTYDPIRDAPQPEGNHIPMQMATMYFSRKKDWERFSESINRFGVSAGLFSDIAVKRMGRSESDPFQIRVKIAGPPSNLIDVGYGVSQVLPIIYESSIRSDTQFLIQQPEVHLHPRGQAELANFFVESYKKNGNNYTIETHSDYLINRLRFLVKSGEIDSSVINILYFSRWDNDIQIFDIRIDEHGNIVNAPKGYRKFFLEEEKRFLGID